MIKFQQCMFFGIKNRVMRILASSCFIIDVEFGIVTEC